MNLSKFLDSLSEVKPKFTLLVICLFLLALMAKGQVSELDAVDKFIKSELARQKIPGVSVAIIKDGKPIHVKGYGFANIEHLVAVKPETIFQSGSVGKQFTSAAIMLLVEDGKLKLDDKIAKHLGEVPESWASITIRHLLSHTGGMADYSNDFDFRKDYTEDDLLKIIRATPLVFAPGEKWQYSNFGYVTLGIIIRKASGVYYGDFLRDRVFKPLEMTTARVISETDIVPNRAAGYVLSKGEVKNQDWVSPTLNTTADGALYLSVLDMIKWNAGLEGGKLLKPESLAAMWSPIMLNNGKPYPYGFGWAVKTVNGSRLIEHGGAWQGFKSFIAKYADDKITVVLFSNLANMDPSKLAHGIAETFDPSLKPIPIKDTEPKITAEFKKLVENLTEGKADRKEFSPELQKALFDNPDRLFEFVKKLGAIKSFVLTEKNVEGSISVYRYNMVYEEMTLDLAIARDKDGKIVMFGLEPS